jgi:hypothetical protein
MPLLRRRNFAKSQVPVVVVGGFSRAKKSFDSAGGPVRCGARRAAGGPAGGSATPVTGSWAAGCVPTLGSGGGTWAAAAAMTDPPAGGSPPGDFPMHPLCRPYGHPVFSPSTTAPRHTRVTSDFLLKMPPSCVTAFGNANPLHKLKISCCGLGVVRQKRSSPISIVYCRAIPKACDAVRRNGCTQSLQ